MADERPYRRWFRLRAQTRADLEREIDEEIAAHLDMRAQEYIARGESAARARAEAVRKFGDYAEARRQLIRGQRGQQRRSRVQERLDSWRRDLSYAWTRARHSPGHTLLALATFALAIGLSTATFTVVNAVLLRALPFAEPERLVSLQSMAEDHQPFAWVSAANWLDWQEQNRTLESTALYDTRRLSVRTGGEAVRVQGSVVTSDFFKVLKVKPRVGRLFSEADLQSMSSLAVVSEGFWRSRLAGGAAESTLLIDGRSYQVTGVVAERDAYPAGTDVWLALRPRREGGETRNRINYEAIGRLAPGVSCAAAQRDLGAIAERIRASDPVGVYSYGVGVLPLKERVVGSASEYLNMLLGAVGFVLLIACANLAGINLARGVNRKREMAVRTSLGAARGALLRQVLIEHLLVALLGGVLGILLARSAVSTLARASAGILPRAAEVTLDGRVLAVACALTLAAGLLTGLWPALQLTRVSLREQMSAQGRNTVRGGRHTPAASLVTVEVALALLLLTGGGLLIRSYRTVAARPLGFNVRDVVTVQVDLPPDRYQQDAQRLRYWQEVEERLRRIPGVAAVGTANWAPLGTGGRSFIEVEGSNDPNASAGYRAVGTSYFRAAGIRVLTGRDFTAADRAGSARVALINQRLAELYWPGQNPLGRRVRATSMELLPNAPPPEWITIVGVVGNVRHFGPEEAIDPELYTSYLQVPFWTRSMTALVRTTVEPQTILPQLRAQLRAIDPQTPAEVAPQSERLAARLQWRRLVLGALNTLAALAVLLAALGLYSLLSFAVAQRTREIAVRVALGARRTNLLRLVLAQAMTVVLLGAALGLLGALALTRFMSALLAEVSPLDPLTLISVTAFLLGIAGLAAALPALRATRTDPLVALNAD